MNTLIGSSEHNVCTETVTEIIQIHKTYSFSLQGHPGTSPKRREQQQGTLFS